MKLREKFKQWLDTEPREEIRDVQLEVIADENAMEFGKWLNNQVLTSGGTHYRLNGRALVSELYVIYKKEKEL
jgi:hypothetical protein